MDGNGDVADQDIGCVRNQIEPLECRQYGLIIVSRYVRSGRTFGEFTRLRPVMLPPSSPSVTNRMGLSSDALLANASHQA